MEQDKEKEDVQMPYFTIACSSYVHCFQNLTINYDDLGKHITQGSNSTAHPIFNFFNEC